MLGWPELAGVDGHLLVTGLSVEVEPECGGSTDASDGDGCGTIPGPSHWLLWDPETGAWSRLPRLPASRRGARAHLHPAAGLVVVGGTDTRFAHEYGPDWEYLPDPDDPSRTWWRLPSDELAPLGPAP